MVKNILSDKFLLKTVINYFDSPYMLNPSSLNRTDAERNPSGTRSIVIQQGAGEKTSQLHSGVTLNYINNNLNVESTVYYLSRKIKNPIPGRIIELKRSAGGLRNTAGYRLVSGHYELNIKGGMDIEFQKDDRVEFENSGLGNININPQDVFSNLTYGVALLDQQENVLNAAPFLNMEVLFEKLRLSGGLRYDYYKFEAADNFLEDQSNDSGLRLLKNFSYMAGLVYRPDDFMKLYLNYSTSFLTPTASELSNNPTGRGGFNQSLLPEKVLSIETGMQAAWNKLSLSAAVYMMNFSDMLIPYQSDNSDEIFYRNAGKARNVGAEISAEYNVSKWLKLSLSYTNLNFTFTDYIVLTEESGLVQLKGNEVPGVPVHNIGFSAFFTFKNFYSKILFNGNEEFYTNDFNGPLPGVNDNINNYINPSVIEMNIRAGYNFSFPSFSLELFSGVNNIFNQKYFSSIVPNATGNRFFEPAPIRNWFAGIRGGF